MSILSSFFDPTLETVEAFLAVDTEGKENSAYSFVKGPHDGSESFLTSLIEVRFTVSHICSLTWVLSSILMVLEVNSTPTVTLYCSENSPLMYLLSMAVFPTPEWSEVITLVSQHDDLKYNIVHYLSIINS